MEYTTGMVVKSLAGHDAGSYYVVTCAQGGFCFIADGRLRSLAAPKKKNPRHLQALSLIHISFRSRGGRIAAGWRRRIALQHLAEHLPLQLHGAEPLNCTCLLYTSRCV